MTVFSIKSYRLAEAVPRISKKMLHRSIHRNIRHNIHGRIQLDNHNFPTNLFYFTDILRIGFLLDYSVYHYNENTQSVFSFTELY